MEQLFWRAGTGKENKRGGKRLDKKGKLLSGMLTTKRPRPYRRGDFGSRKFHLVMDRAEEMGRGPKKRDE